MDLDAGTTGQVIEQLRANEGWTQGDLAVRAHMLQPHIAMIEGDLRPNLTLETLAKLASAFRMPRHKLVQLIDKATGAPVEEDAVLSVV